jgi:hypothetical protein
MTPVTLFRAALVSTLVAALPIACSSQASAPPTLGDQQGNGNDATTGNDGTVTVTSGIPTGLTPSLVLVGGKVPVAPGTKVGYALTAVAPMSYMFRWTGDSSVTGDGFQHFYGTIWTTGHFTSITPGCTNMACPRESGDTVSSIMQVTGGEAITWSTNASDGWDGFSFVTDTEPVIYQVNVDTQPRQDLFLFPEYPTGTPTSPTTDPFALSSMAPGDGGSPDGGSSDGADEGGEASVEAAAEAGPESGSD